MKNSLKIPIETGACGVYYTFEFKCLVFVQYTVLYFQGNFLLFSHSDFLPLTFLHVNWCLIVSSRKFP